MGKTYAFIPARGNSKRLPGKNFKLINGKPLIYYTIKAAIESNVDKVYFSTEDSRLAEKANDFVLTDLDRSGTKFDILDRHPKLSLDTCQTDAVYWDMLATLMESPELEAPETLVLLQPTSPLRDAKDINMALNIWNTSDKSGCLVSGHVIDGFLWSVQNNTVSPVGHDPRFRLGKQWIKDAPVHFIENGAIYIVNAEQFHHYRTYRMPPYQFFEMPANKSVDIDTKRDFNRAAELINFVGN